MNYREYMENVETELVSGDEEHLRGLLRKIARLEPEEKREDFIALLKDEPKDGADGLISVEEEEIRKLNELFSLIEEEEAIFYASGHEEYEDGYWDSDWAYEYEDSMGIGPQLENAYRLARKLAERGLYESAQELLDQLLNVEVYCSDEDGSDDMSLDLADMVEEGLIHIDMDQIAAISLYIRYKTQKGRRRMDEMYDIFCSAGCSKLRIEDMLQAAPEEPEDLLHFYTEWLEYLLTKKEDRATELLKEAVALAGGGPVILNSARIAPGLHPILYELAISEALGREAYEEAVSIGTEALEAVSRDYKIRAKLALLTAEACQKTGNTELYADCCKEAFCSDSTVTNYLRILSLPEGGKEYQEELEAVLERVKSEKSSLPSYEVGKERIENRIDADTYKAVRVVMGHYDEGITWCKTQKKGLGWSSHFISTGVPLFLTLLCENAKPGLAQRELLGRNMDRLKFEGTALDGVQSDEEKKVELWQCLKKVKEFHPISATMQKEYDDYLYQAVNMRVDALVGGGKRNYYWQAALFTAALGEAMESQGKENKRKEIVDEVMRRYPRHSAFKGEMRKVLGRMK